MTFPIQLERHGHGAVMARTELELKNWVEMGWVAIANEPPAYALFPMWLKAGGLPDLLVDNAAEARKAAERGYQLPSDTAIAIGKEGFEAAFAPDRSRWLVARSAGPCRS
jgi:hypothetical protein